MDSFGDAFETTAATLRFNTSEQRFISVVRDSKPANSVLSALFAIQKMTVGRGRGPGRHMVSRKLTLGNPEHIMFERR